MFERFTDRARRAVVLAQEESRLLNHAYIGTEHILLGLIHESEGLAAQVLTAAGLRVDQVRAEVSNRVAPGSEHPKGHIPFTPRAKKVLELSLRESIKLGHRYIGTEHVLLGLLAEGEGVAALILLSEVEGGLDRLRADTLAAMTMAGSLTATDPEKIQARVREAMSARAAARVVIGDDDAVIKRLEAIEARLSAIERLLREQRGEATA